MPDKEESIDDEYSDSSESEDDSNDLGEMISPGLPEFQQLRNVVSNANYFVRNMEKSSDVFLAVIRSIKKHLKKANVLVATLEKAQKESVVKMLNIRWVDAAVQANSSEAHYRGHKKHTQTLKIEDVLMYLVLVSKELSPAPSSILSSVDESKDSSKSDTSLNDPINLLVEQKKNKSRESSAKQGSGIDADHDKTQIATLNKVVLKEKKYQNRKFRRILVFTIISSIIADILLGITFLNTMGKKKKLEDLLKEMQTTFKNYVPRCPTKLHLEHGQVSCEITAGIPPASPSKKFYYCKFKCDLDYRMTGSKILRCIGKDNWSASLPKCVYTPCNKVQDRDCANLARLGKASTSGIYEITQCGDFLPINVNCNFEIGGGGWTAIQRRINDKVDFKRSYKEFQNYFGDPKSGYWIGLKNLNYLTNTEAQTLLVILTDWFYPTYHLSKSYAMYRLFRVGNINAAFQLHASEFKIVSLPFENAGDSLRDSDGMQFTALDADHDWNALNNCADLTGAAWWHRNCTEANLNAPYTDKREYGDKSMYWKTWRKHANLRSAEMFIRPNEWKN